MNTCNECRHNGECTAQQQHPHDSGPDQPYCDGFAVLWFLTPPEDRTRFRKARTCEACGVDGVFSTPCICTNCRELLREAWQARQNQTVSRHYVDFAVYAPSLTHDASSQLLATICQNLAALFPRVGSYDLPHIPQGEDIVVTTRSRWSDDWRYLLTPAQAPALQAILAALTQLVDTVYRDGFERGRSLLAGLGDGTLSVKDVNEWCRRYGQPDPDKNV